MRSLCWLVCLSGLFLAAVFIPHARCGEIKFTREWKGSVDDEDLRKNAPARITSAKVLKKLWKDWKIETGHTGPYHGGSIGLCLRRASQARKADRVEVRIAQRLLDCRVTGHAPRPCG